MNNITGIHYLLCETRLRKQESAEEMGKDIRMDEIILS